MDFDLSDDQLALRAAARDLLADLAHPREADGFDASLWKAMADQGWLGVEVPEADGGLGMGTVEAAVLMEELGRHVAPVPYLQTALALGALHRAGRADWVERLLAGDAIGTVAARPGALTIAAPLADVAVVVDGDGLVLVDLTDRRPTREPAMDLTRPLGWLAVAEGEGERIGDADAARRLYDRAATGHAAEMLGAADRALTMAVDYAKEREQFGQPIGSFQAVKHRCADMLVDVEGMRSAVYYAAWSIGADHPDASIAASTAKVWCSDAARRVMASALQVHGGIGFTWEHDLHLYLKRSQLDQVSFGDSAAHRERLAGLLRQRVERGESVV
jgi:alkylation response protein AidB-like acyl-CoA dehydrogenase